MTERSTSSASLADNYIEDRPNLNELMVEHPAATFVVRVAAY